MDDELKKIPPLWDKSPDLIKELGFSTSIVAAMADRARLEEHLGLTHSLAKMFAEQDAIAKQYTLMPAFQHVFGLKDVSAVASVLETLRGHDFLPSVAIGPLAELKGYYRDATYELSLNSREFDQLDRKQIQDVANQIVAAIAGVAPDQLPIRSRTPLRWSFRKVPEGEQENQSPGIVVSHQQSMRLDDSDDDNAKAGTTSQIQSQLEAAVAKFGNYSECRRLVLLDFYGTELGEDEIPELFTEVSIPNAVDEVWRTVRDWTSEDTYDIGYNRLHPRS